MTTESPRLFLRDCTFVEVSLDDFSGCEDLKEVCVGDGRMDGCIRGQREKGRESD